MKLHQETSDRAARSYRSLPLFKFTVGHRRNAGNAGGIVARAIKQRLRLLYIN